MDGLEHNHTYTSDNYAGFYFRRLRQSTKSATFEPLENLHGMAHCIGTCWHHLSIGALQLPFRNGQHSFSHYSGIGGSI